MANKDYNKEDGVWRTIGGRRVFIKNGQSLADAMKESGKFSRVQKNQDLYKKLDDEKKDGVELNEKQKEAGERLNKKAENGVLNDIKDFLSGKEDYDGSREEFMNDLSKEWGVDKERVEELYQEQKEKSGGRLFKPDRPAEATKLGQRSDDNEVIDLDKKSMSREDYDKLYDKKVYDEGMSESQFKKEYGERPNESGEENVETPKANVDLKKLAKSKYGSSIEDYDKLIKEQVGEGKSQKEYDDLKEQVDKVYKEEMSKKHEMLSNEEFKKLVKDTYGNMSYVNEMGLSVDQVKEQLIKDANDEIEYWKNQDKDYWKDIGAEPNQQVKAYEKLRDFVSNYGNKTGEKPKKETFTQQVDFGNTSRDYTKEDLKRMEDAGIRPMEHSYTGGGWEGVNSDKNMDTKDQAKAITDAIKKKYPDVKVARKSNLFSGGSSIDFNIMSSDKDLFVSDSDIDKMGYEDLHDVSSSNGFEWWAKDNVPNYNENHSYNIDDVRKYAKQSLAQRKTTDIQGVKGNEWYLNDYGKKVVSDLNKEANSYTYNDSDGMIDYFDHGTYMHISIGKWNKPYQVTGNSVTSAIRNKAYQKYLKEHPSSKMTLAEFKKSQKK